MISRYILNNDDGDIDDHSNCIDKDDNNSGNNNEKE